MITFRQRGNFKKTDDFLNRAKELDFLNMLEKYGQEGITALSSATPIDSGETVSSWKYEIKRTKKSVTLTWINTNIVDGVPIAVIIQYGHGTKNGGYVQGRDYINPAIRPIFDKIINEMWKGVTK